MIQHSCFLFFTYPDRNNCISFKNMMNLNKTNLLLEPSHGTFWCWFIPSCFVCFQNIVLVKTSMILWILLILRTNILIKQSLFINCIMPRKFVTHDVTSIVFIAKWLLIYFDKEHQIRSTAHMLSLSECYHYQNTSKSKMRSWWNAMERGKCHDCNEQL